MDEARRSGRRVPANRPFLLGELNRTVPGVDDRVRALGEDAGPAEYEDVADRLWSLFLVARELAPTRSRTGCDVHPDGPVDPLAPEGWTRCLLCNRNRRIGDPSVPGVETGRAPGQRYEAPRPPYTREALTEALRRVRELQLDLGPTSPNEEFARLAEAVHRAFVTARELSRPRTASGCARHPGAPVDPTAEETGGAACLFCRGEETRRARQGPPVPRPRRTRPRRRIGHRITPPPRGDRPDGPPSTSR
ncbi:hypothetical protein RM572_14255 [Streptomyces sp. DSM 42041]|uniref:Uncharacterized protein n=1 Tax=Streptomyces hazeniae TaxID=3075538 RepID=A0ABU2NT36_9ACTN|nr:hypothetical protein [Streptomyces sp. DSM 42041]MDT0379924.1 hypothetical protein [Streptomyces sp. DSM 42041]